MFEKGLAYTQMHNTQHADTKKNISSDYYKEKCNALKKKLKQYESENEKLIEENGYLLEKNNSYCDTISVPS